jgi:hypothetical protein
MRRLWARLAHGCWLRHGDSAWEGHRLRCTRCWLVVWDAHIVRAKLCNEQPEPSRRRDP